MIEILIISIGLMLVIEGLIYFFFANNLKLVINVLQQINPKKVKNISLTIVFIGFCLIYFTIRQYI